MFSPTGCAVFIHSFNGIAAREEKKSYIYVSQRELSIWSGGRVARQRSAKPRTAVRIRSRPQILNKPPRDSEGALLFPAASEACFCESLEITKPAIGLLPSSPAP